MSIWHSAYASFMALVRRTVLKKQVKRDEMAMFFANLPSCLIGMEACGSAHNWARNRQSQEQLIKLMAPQFIMPYVKATKNDAADSEAICEAVTRPTMRFVPYTFEQVPYKVHQVIAGICAIGGRSIHCFASRPRRAETGGMKRNAAPVATTSSAVSGIVSVVLSGRLTRNCRSGPVEISGS